MRVLCLVSLFVVSSMSHPILKKMFGHRQRVEQAAANYIRLGATAQALEVKKNTAQIRQAHASKDYAVMEFMDAVDPATLSRQASEKAAKVNEWFQSMYGNWNPEAMQSRIIELTGKLNDATNKWKKAKKQHEEARLALEKLRSQ